ncbi:MAG TPA: hypothetical protein EYP91_19535 [Gammaproteobacteria bacterium]|nr:hypothetical protein [Gammaproteobacteria bacterium]
MTRPVFAINIEKREKHGRPARIIALIEERSVAGVKRKILKHLGLDQPGHPQNRSPPSDLAEQPTTLL